MSSRKLLVLSALVVGLFAFIFFFERKLPSTGELRQKGDLHWDLPDDRVDSIRLTRGGEVVELAKTGEEWKLVRPLAYPADSFTASDLATSLADLKKPAGESEEADGKPEDYGLAKPTASATFTWTDPVREGRDAKPGARHSRTVEFGIDIPGTDLTAARVAGQRQVLFVPSTVKASVVKPVDDFKSKEVFQGPLEVAAIDVARGRGRLVLAKKNGVWWIDQPIVDLADRETVDRLSGDLSALRVTEFVAGSPDPATLGLEPPLFRVTLHDAKGARHELELGSTRSEGDSVYASRQGQVFTIPGSVVDELSKEAVAFRDKRLVRFERADVQAVEASLAGRKFSFRREPAGWSSGGRSVLASAADDLLTAILDVGASELLEDAAARSLTGRPAESTLEVRLSRGNPWAVRVHPNRGELAATVSGRPGAFRVTREALDKLREALEKASSAPAPTPAPTGK